MEYLILGPLEVRRDGGPVALGGVKPRALLAVLLLQANKPVSVEQLALALWGEDAPAGAVKAVRVHVSRLRKALGNGDVVATTQAGYSLRVLPGELDAERLAQLVEEGRQALASAAAEQAAAVLREALSLWRGPPLADLAGEAFAAPEIRRLEELRLAATELAIDLELAEGRHRDVVGELEALVAGHPLREHLHAQRMLALYRSCRQADALAAYRQARTTLVETIGVEPGAELRRLHEAILRQDPSLELPLAPALAPEQDAATPLAAAGAARAAEARLEAVAGRAASDRTSLRGAEAELADDIVELQVARERADAREALPDVVVCPFKGLASFDVGDADFFFGRERLVAEMIARLAGSPVLGVVGPSGSGKSSALRAGLLAALAKGTLPGSEDWALALLRPGEHPAAALEQAIREADARGRLVVAVDQFEETFTLCHDEAERAAFVDALMAVARDSQRRAAVIVAVRADFYGRCAAYPEFSRLLAANHVLVGPMGRHEVRRAIELPPKRAGLRPDPELVDRLLADVEGEPGALPLLSTALLALWQRRDGHRLTQAAYEQSGALRGAVARLAEAAYAPLGAEEQRVARGILVRLAGEGEGDAVVRRRVPLRELGPSAARVLDVLATARLVTVSKGTAEVAHEALLREWPRLRGWLEEDAQGRRLHRHLAETAHDWDEGGRDAGDLYRGARLASALEWRTTYEHELNECERAFLDASDARRQHEQAARRRRLRLVLVGLTVALAAITVIAVIAVYQGREATLQRDIGASRELAASAAGLLRSDPGLSLGLAMEALKRRETEQAQNALRQATLAVRETAVLRGHDGWFSVATPSRDGRYVATGGQNGVVRVWSLARGRVVSTIRGHEGKVYGTSFSPDGRRVASGGADGVIAIADADGRHRRTLRRYADGTYVSSVEFSADGSRLLAAVSDGTVRLVPVDGRGRDIVLRGHRGAVYEARLNRDGTRVVSAGADNRALLWDVASRTSTPLPHPDQVTGAGFSPDGRRVATVCYDGNLRIWDADSGRRVARVGADRQALYAVRYSSDGRRLVTAGEDGVVRVLDVRGEPALAELKGHRGRALQASFVGSGDAVVSVGEDGTLRTWTPPRTAQVRARLTGASFSPDGRSVVGGSEGGAVRTWNVATGSMKALRGQQQLNFARFSPDGTRIVSASSDGTVRVWTADGRRSSVIRAGGSEKYAAAMDPAGRRVAIAGKDPRIVIQPVGGGPRVVLSGHSEPVYDVAFSPDGRHLVSASEDGTARIWNAADGTQERVLQGHREAVNSAAYSEDGRRVVTAGSDATVRVWRVADGSSVVLRGHEGPLQTARFNSDGDRVVSAGQDGTVRVWNAAGGETLVLLHAHRGRAWGADFSRDGKLVVSAGDDGVVRISPCETCGPLTAVQRLAQRRADRELDAIDRQRYMPGRD